MVSAKEYIQRVNTRIVNKKHDLGRRIDEASDALDEIFEILQDEIDEMYDTVDEEQERLEAQRHLDFKFDEYSDLDDKLRDVKMKLIGIR